MAIISTRRPVRKPRPTPVRSYHLPLAPFGQNPGVLDIIDGKVITSFFLYPVASDFGLAYRLEKFAGHQRGDDDAVYHVCLEHDTATCDCKGGCYCQKCRHVEALRDLQAKGKLPLPPVANAPAFPVLPVCPLCHERPAKCGCHGQPEDDAA
jgi:hypothetical protein